MHRRSVLALLLAQAPLISRAQERGTATIGLLGVGSPGSRDLLQPVAEGLRDFGYQEGRNLTLVDRSQVDRYENLAIAAKELARLKLDVVICWGSAAPRAAMAAMPKTPIVLVGGDPVASGLAQSYSRPGGNVTGLATMSLDLIGKLLELMKETLPGLLRISALLNPGSPTELRSMEQAGRDAQRLGLELRRAEIGTAEDFEPAIAKAAREKAQALLLIPSTMLYVNRRRIAAAAVQHRLPSAGVFIEFAEAGTLLGYGPDRQKLMRQAARFAARILKGESPATMAIERATQFELAINLKTAAALGVTIPDVVRFRAGRIIE